MLGCYNIFFIIDNVVMQLIDLKVLATALGKGDKSLIYLYKEHNVSIQILLLKVVLLYACT